MVGLVYRFVSGLVPVPAASATLSFVRQSLPECIPTQSVGTREIMVSYGKSLTQRQLLQVGKAAQRTASPTLNLNFFTYINTLQLKL